MESLINSLNNLDIDNYKRYVIMDLEEITVICCSEDPLPFALQNTWDSVPDIITFKNLINYTKTQGLNIMINYLLRNNKDHYPCVLQCYLDYYVDLLEDHLSILSSQ